MCSRLVSLRCLVAWISGLAMFAGSATAQRTPSNSRRDISLLIFEVQPTEDEAGAFHLKLRPDPRGFVAEVRSEIADQLLERGYIKSQEVRGVAERPRYVRFENRLGGSQLDFGRYKYTL